MSELTRKLWKDMEEGDLDATIEGIEAALAKRKAAVKNTAEETKKVIDKGTKCRKKRK